MKRKPDAGAVINALSQYDSHQKMLTLIYKSSAIDLKSKAKITNSRVHSK